MSGQSDETPMAFLSNLFRSRRCNKDLGHLVQRQEDVLDLIGTGDSKLQPISYASRLRGMIVKACLVPSIAVVIAGVRTSRGEICPHLSNSTYTHFQRFD